MRIYICLPDKPAPDREHLRTNLHSALTKFYGRFPQSDIEFFTSPDTKTTVYIMEKAPRLADESLIIKSITQILGDTVNVKLNYHAETPHYSFDQVILPEDTRSKILEAVATIQVEPKVFDEWGLRTIIPYAASAMSFYGRPSTGKTMAAEAAAHMLGKKLFGLLMPTLRANITVKAPKWLRLFFSPLNVKTLYCSSTNLTPCCRKD